jgi:hypothetical protein
MDAFLSSPKLRKDIEAFLVQQNKFNVSNNFSQYRVNSKFNSDILNRFEKKYETLKWTNLSSSTFLINVDSLEKVTTESKVETIKGVDSQKMLTSVYSAYFQPGIYAIACFATGRVYFGETSNLANRYTDTRRAMYNGRYSCKQLLKDIKKHGIEALRYFPFYFGADWVNLQIRKDAERTLIQLNNDLCYNIQERIPEKREVKQNDRTVGVNGFAIPIRVRTKIYGSISQIKREYDLSWKQVNDRIKDNLNYPEWQYAEGETGFETMGDLPDTLFLVGNKVFKSKRSLIRLEQFDTLSKSAVDNRFKSHSFPEWRSIKKDEFMKLVENQVFVFMWKRPNDHPERE